MNFKDEKAVRKMRGKSIWRVYANFTHTTSSGGPIYKAAKDEYVILGLQKEGVVKQVILFDVKNEDIDFEHPVDIQNRLNHCVESTYFFSGDFAWAFTEERADKCLQALSKSIAKQEENYIKSKKILHNSFTFSLDQLEEEGISILETMGIEVKTNAGSVANLSLTDGYEEIYTKKSLLDLSFLRSIAKGKSVFEFTGADKMNLHLKGKMVFAQDIEIMIISETDLNKKGTFTNKLRPVPSRYINWRIYFKLPNNNYVSIKKFNKFFNAYRFEKQN